LETLEFPVPDVIEFIQASADTRPRRTFFTKARRADIIQISDSLPKAQQKDSESVQRKRFSEGQCLHERSKKHCGVGRTRNTLSMLMVWRLAFGNK
jgi:hypothetical protein